MSTERIARSGGKHVLLIVENVPIARDHRLRKQVSALRQAGYRVSVICRSDPDNDDGRVGHGVRLYQYRAPADAGSKLGYLWEYGYSWVMAALLALRVFLTDRFDAIQISGTPDIYFAIGAVFRLFGAPLVLDQRDLTPDLYEMRYGRRDAMYRILRWFERHSYSAADRIVTVNGALRDMIRDRGGEATGEVTVVGNGPVLARVRGHRPDPSLKDGKRYLCCWAGLMGPQDGLELVLPAIAELPAPIRDECRFVFIGDGEYRLVAESLAAELGVSGAVEFTGWLPEPEVFGYLATADLGLEPNVHDIVSPVKGHEYMAFGVPYVAFDTEQTRVMSGPAACYAKRGEVTEFANLIAKLLADDAARERMGRAGRERVERDLSWEHQQQAYLAMYRRLLGG
ncbi:glycosyltransferase family 4 protein [Amycolatopsis thermophila]|uniref:Glycosyltransferase involved in cell wall biosynthesis n=1 Tax=Amycolatopsis thermophila TaxID=206084 RepID=A0ABU0F1T4_9PSEU|nr:glycosyltransferase family 4 protein [Amycolatopsis thermophila]MDQ0381539.1 glycosyltransferase involved in cell wall biosynthesis [Amycolatopsis thermophila]